MPVREGMRNTQGVLMDSTFIKLIYASKWCRQKAKGASTAAICAI